MPVQPIAGASPCMDPPTHIFKIDAIIFCNVSDYIEKHSPTVMLQGWIGAVFQSSKAENPSLHVRDYTQ
jgi:hypothetical protein